MTARFPGINEIRAVADRAYSEHSRRMEFFRNLLELEPHLTREGSETGLIINLAERTAIQVQSGVDGSRMIEQILRINAHRYVFGFCETNARLVLHSEE